MMFRLRTFALIVLFFLPISLLRGQTNTNAPSSTSLSDVDHLDRTIKILEDEINRHYFTEAISKNYAIASARFAEESYFYAKDIHQGYNLNRTFLQKARANADTSFWFLKRSMVMADSAIYFASDTNHIALDYMHGAIEHLALTEQHLRAIYTTNDASQTRIHGTNSMFEASNALVDAYHASLYFGGDKRPDESDDAFKDRQVTRLEADGAAFNALLYMYEERIKNLEDEIAELKASADAATPGPEQDRLKEQLDLVSEEKARMETKLSGARNQLGDIDSQLVLQNQALSAADTSGNSTAAFSGNTGDVESPFVLDKELPMGLVYRVQIGYYPIENTPKFHGVTSVDGKLVGNYIRYYTGIYSTYADATDAKNKVREYIIDDAFLVAFFDRKKVSVYDALQIEKEQAAAAPQE